MTDVFSDPLALPGPHPLAIFPSAPSHPVSAAKLRNPNNLPIPTNKRYTNLFLPDGKGLAAWTLPYIIWETDNGVGICHPQEHQLGYGPDPNADPVQYYINPRILSIELGGIELGGSGKRVELSDFTNHAIQWHHLPADGSGEVMYPLADNMGFVTAVYSNVTPLIGSDVLFRQLIPMNSPGAGVQKWKAVLEDNTNWVIYVSLAPGQPQVQLRLVSNRRIETTSGRFNGYIQVAKIGNGGDGESVLDQTAGMYITGETPTMTVSDGRATYGLDLKPQGNNVSGKLLSYWLPHHAKAFTPETAAEKKDSHLRSTTKGDMIAVVSNTIRMQVDVPDVDLLPEGWRNISESTKSYILDVAWAEAQRISPDAESNLPSMYFSGKALTKYAQICSIIVLLGSDIERSKYCLNKLKTAMDRFTKNRQINPLVYDPTFKGIISSSPDPWQDFGNSHYNDHHFHYAYHVLPAATITILEAHLGMGRQWVDENSNWTNSLLKDYINPSPADPDFPQLRAFDFIHGHSWAKGLFASADGKDEESSSEDVNSIYAALMWGKATGNQRLIQLASGLLGITRTSMNEYLLMHSSNTTQPKNFIKNKVSGIHFENKVDYATYFGARPEYKHGIHVLPVTPAGMYVRGREFVKEEWETIWWNGEVGRIQQIEDGWKGIIYIGLAVYDAKASWEFFRNGAPLGGWRDAFLDGGMSRSWGLLIAASQGGASE